MDNCEELEKVFEARAYTLRAGYPKSGISKPSKKPAVTQRLFYTPQFSATASVSVRRLAWALGITRKRRG
jgi:hypothetical protein